MVPIICAILSMLTLSASLDAQPPAKGSLKVTVGLDRLAESSYASLLRGKRVGLITNHTAINSQVMNSIEVIKQLSSSYRFTLKAIFAPEHGLYGATYAENDIESTMDEDGIPIFSLFGKHQRPSDKMLQDIDLLIYDIQDIGSRSYTYISTLFYVMEAAAKKKIPVVVLDRPNPINGLVVDGPMLNAKWRSIVGYINVPYCHGMTTGELAQFFNEEYKVGCQLTVITMKNWKRRMSFNDTGLLWIPTSPYIPEATTALYYPVTGVLGELSIVNIGIGYTLPFKLIGAPWIDAQQFAKALNKQKFPGVHFEPFHYKPFYGKFAKEQCHGVLIAITNPLCYKPLATQFLIVGMLKSLYPEKFKEGILQSKNRKNMFCKVTGTEEVYRMMAEENNIVWKLRGFEEKERADFMNLRKKYLIADYGDP